MSHGILPVRDAEVEIIQRESLLEDGRIGAFGERHKDRVGVSHVVSADDVGGIRESARMLVVCRAKEKGGGIDCSCGDDNDIGGVGRGLAFAFHDYSGDFAS